MGTTTIRWFGTVLILMLAACGGGNDDGAPRGPGEGEGDDGTGEQAPPGSEEGGQAGNGPVSLSVPAACTSDDDCPDGIACVGAAGGETGHCNVDEAVAGDEASSDEEGSGGAVPISSAAPALCSSDDDCPEGVRCAQLSDDGPGFCDVEEMVAGGSE